MLPLRVGDKIGTELWGVNIDVRVKGGAAAGGCEDVNLVRAGDAYWDSYSAFVNGSPEQHFQSQGEGPARFKVRTPGEMQLRDYIEIEDLFM